MVVATLGTGPELSQDLLSTFMKSILSGPVTENAEALAVATKEIGLEVNADKTKYMVMSREQTAGLSHTMKVDSRSIERVKEFKYLEQR